MKELDLGKEKLGKLLITFSIPCIVSMLINSIYNIVDQIFIGQGVGYLGNAATNVIFPIVLVCTAIAQLFGNGCAANLSLRLGEGKKEEAKKSVGGTVTTLVIAGFVFSVIAYIFLPTLINLCGCTENVFPYAMSYGRIILLGAPFMIIYTGLSAIIRADGSPKYSMICLLIGAIINIILDPIFIFGFDMGVEGGALATIIGQIVSAIIALAYLRKTKSVKLSREDYIPDKSIVQIAGYGTSSFITQMTVLALFIFMNNIMTAYGLESKFGGDIPLSVYGIVSKLNNLYVSAVLGIAVGAQPIIGYNYGAGKYDRVKKLLKLVVIINFIIGFIFNAAILLFPKELVSLFGSADDALYLEFAIDCCRIFLMVSVVNAFEMTSSIVIQSLGNIKKATAVAFTRQIILFIPIALLLTHYIGLYGALYAGPIADLICFVFVIYIFGSEYIKVDKKTTDVVEIEEDGKLKNIIKDKVIITINREYGSGGRYIGKMLAESLGIKYYDRNLIRKASIDSGLSEEFIKEHEEKRVWGSGLASGYDGDDKVYIAECNAIKEIAKNESCVIIGRCGNFILKDEENVCSIFIYSDEENKTKRAIEHYNIDKKTASKEVQRINKLRSKYYEFYTGRKWNDLGNYDLAFNSDYLGTADTANLIKKIVLDKYNTGTLKNVFKNISKDKKQK